MKIKTFKIGDSEVRLTRQSESAHYGPGVYVIRRLHHGKLRDTKSTADEGKASELFASECFFARGLETESVLSDE